MCVRMHALVFVHSANRKEKILVNNIKGDLTSRISLIFFRFCLEAEFILLRFLFYTLIRTKNFFLDRTSRKYLKFLWTYVHTCTYWSCWKTVLDSTENYFFSIIRITFCVSDYVLMKSESSLHHSFLVQNQSNQPTERMIGGKEIKKNGKTRDGILRSKYNQAINNEPK